jgi:hypothetical protein
MKEFLDAGEAVKFIEEGLKAELKKEGLKEVVADFLDCKRWFAESFRCPVSAEELNRIIAHASDRVLMALKEEGIKNSEFMIKNVEYIQDRDTKDYIMRCTIYFEEEEVKAVPTEEKFIVKGCYNLVNSIYADGREAQNECGNSSTDEKCSDVKSCPVKQAVETLLKVANAGNCQRWDGCGYFEGCNDQECGTYAACKSLDLLGVEIEK